MYIQPILMLALCMLSSAQLRGLKQQSGQLPADTPDTGFDRRVGLTQPARVLLQHGESDDAAAAAAAAAGDDDDDDDSADNSSATDDDDDSEESDQSEVLVVDIHIHERQVLVAAGNFTLPGQRGVWYVLCAVCCVLCAVSRVLCPTSCALTFPPRPRRPGSVRLRSKTGSGGLCLERTCSRGRGRGRGRGGAPAAPAGQGQEQGQAW